MSSPQTEAEAQLKRREERARTSAYKYGLTPEAGLKKFRERESARQALETEAKNYVEATGGKPRGKQEDKAYYEAYRRGQSPSVGLALHRYSSPEQTKARDLEAKRQAEHRSQLTQEERDARAEQQFTAYRQAHPKTDDNNTVIQRSTVVGKPVKPANGITISVPFEGSLSQDELFSGATYEYDEFGFPIKGDISPAVREKYGLTGKLEIRKEGNEAYAYYHGSDADYNRVDLFGYDRTLTIPQSVYSKLSYEALQNVNQNLQKTGGGTVTKDLINAEIFRLTGTKYASGIEAPLSEKQKRGLTNQAYAIFKANQIVEAGNKGETSAYSLSKDDVSYLRKSGVSNEDALSIANLGKDIKVEKDRLKQENKQARVDYVRDIRKIRAEAKEDGYTAVPSKYDTEGYITEFTFKPIKGQRQYQREEVYNDPTNPYAGTHTERTVVPNSAIDSIENLGKNYAPEKSNAFGQFGEFGRGVRSGAEGIAEIAGHKPVYASAFNTLLGINPYQGKYQKREGETDAQFRTRVRQAEAKRERPEIGSYERGKGPRVTKVEPVLGSAEYQKQETYKIIETNPARFAGELFFEGAAVIATTKGSGAVIKAGIKGARYVGKGARIVRELATGEAKAVVKPPKLRLIEYGKVDVLETGTIPKPTLRERASNLKQSLTSGKPISEFSFTRPSIKVTRKVSLKKGVTGPEVDSTTTESTGGVQGSQTYTEPTTSEPVISEPPPEPILSPELEGVKTDLIAQAGKPKIKSPFAPKRNLAKEGKQAITNEFKKASGKVKHDLIRDIMGKGKAKGLSGKERTKQLQERQTALTTLQNVLKPKKLKAEQVRGFFSTEGKGRAEEIERRTETARTAEFRATASESRTIQVLERQKLKSEQAKRKKSPLQNIPLSPLEPTTEKQDNIREQEKRFYAEETKRRKAKASSYTIYEDILEPLRRPDESRRKDKGSLIFDTQRQQGFDSSNVLVPVIDIPLNTPARPQKEEINKIPLFKPITEPITGARSGVIHQPVVGVKTEVGLKPSTIEITTPRQTTRQQTKFKEELIPNRVPRIGIPLRPFGGGGGFGAGKGQGKSGATSIEKLAVANILFPSLSLKGSGEQSKGADVLLGLSKPKSKGKKRKKSKSLLSI